jgi:dephospho-CoA kinase
MSQVILVIGKQATGKTTLINQFLDKTKFPAIRQEIVLIQELLDVLEDEQDRTVYAESNTITIDQLQQTVFTMLPYFKHKVRITPILHGNLTQIITCRRDKSPLYHFFEEEEE